MSPHPSSRWQPDLDRCRRRLAELLADEGAPCPELGASALLLRGIAGVDRATWASTRGISELEVFRMEAGEWWGPPDEVERRRALPAGACSVRLRTCASPIDTGC